MAKRHTFFSFKDWWLTPAEMGVLGLAGFVIWLAKFQDRMMAQSGYSHRPAARETSVLGTLGNIPTASIQLPDLDDSDNRVPAPPPPMQAVGVHRSEELRKFLGKFRHHQQLRYQAPKLKPQEWEALEKNATVTFGYVEEIFQGAAAKTRLTLSPQEIQNDPVLADFLFKNFEMRFGLSEKECRQFAADNTTASISDWAFYIESRM